MSMRFKKYLLILLLFYYGNSFACKCREFEKEIMVERGLESADIVFYGELIKLDTISNTYAFKIIELFKGNYEPKTITSFSESNCDFYFNEKGLCIIYANFNKNKTLINISACSPSQSMDFGPGFPPIPFEFDSSGKTVPKNEIEMKLFDLENKNKSLSTFIYQLEKLRQYKLAQNTITTQMKNDFSDKALIISLIVNAILLLTIIFLIVSKKTSNNRITK